MTFLAPKLLVQNEHDWKQIMSIRMTIFNSIIGDLPYEIHNYIVNYSNGKIRTRYFLFWEEKIRGSQLHVV